uniref:Uncharacterized protein n=1 Tax=Avena sativa TaxID=4498 RepID=A0ACD5VGW4_AVESA
MAPQQRPEDEPPPNYLRGSGYFSVEIHHGGYFLGQGNNRSYVGGASVWYDHLDSDEWTPVFLENLVEDLGYEMQGRMNVFYCIPILSIENNGLRKLVDEIDTSAMANWVGCGNHFISIYLDHDESIRAVDWDDVVAFPIVQLPPVLSPVKPINIVTADDASSHVVDDSGPFQEVQPQPFQEVQPHPCVKTRSKVRNADNSETEDASREKSESSEDADSDFEFNDSEVDLSDDDDLYADNVDDDEEHVKKMKMKRTVKFEDEGESEDEDLWAPDSDEEKVQMKFKTFRREDLGSVTFHVGLKFESVDMGLINAVRDQFPESEHRFCVRHLWQNFQMHFKGDALKNQLWIIARSSTAVKYEKNMEHMKALNPDAYAWLDNLDPRTWVRAFQSDISKCDILLNNNCEVFNK